jgi:hypothetical protein
MSGPREYFRWLVKKTTVRDRRVCKVDGAGRRYAQYSQGKWSFRPIGISIIKRIVT